MKKSKIMSTYRLSDITRERIKAMARELEYSEAQIIELLVDQYYKMQIYVDVDGEWEYIPFFETKETYQKSKDDYKKEYDVDKPRRGK